MFDDVFPSQYMIKPVIIQAAQLTKENIYKIAAWCNGRVDGEEKYIRIFEAEEGDVLLTVSLGSYVIQGEFGAFYSCDEATFQRKYSEVVPNAQGTV